MDDCSWWRIPRYKETFWFNPVTNQMFLEIYGIRKPQNRDYQLWMIYKDNHVRDQILPVKNGSIKIFIQGKNFHQIKQIRASMEPKGGSIIQTGPDTFIIEVKVLIKTKGIQ